MTVDGRLEKLAERHEALTLSVEILTADIRDSSRTLASTWQKFLN